jgi:hypothetical protein
MTVSDLASEFRTSRDVARSPSRPENPERVTEPERPATPPPRRTRVYTPPPEPPQPAEFIGNFVTPEHSNRDRYEVYVFNKIGGNPFEIDPHEEVGKAMKNLPDLFHYVFRGKIRWHNRHKLNRKQAKFWQNAVDRYRAGVYDEAVSRKNTLMQQYNWEMNRFDYAWAEYQSALNRYRIQLADWKMRQGR